MSVKELRKAILVAEGRAVAIGTEKELKHAQIAHKAVSDVLTRWGETWHSD